MSPDDERHGSYAGAVAHWFDHERPCPACFTAETRYRKARKLKHLRGEPVTFPAVGILRRIRALHALGWTGPQIAADAGVSLCTMRSIAAHEVKVVHWSTASAIIASYDRLSMKRPEGHYANRARSMAKRRDWSPPLAWDDIDDPSERPQGIYNAPVGSTAFNFERTAKRLADLEHAAEHGHTLARVLSDLEIGEEGLWKWCKRNDRDDLWRLFKGRQDERDGRGSDAA